MRPPNLCHALVLEAPEHISDGAGGFYQGWTVLGTLWADITSGTGRGAASTGAPTSRVDCKIIVRGAPFGSPDRPKPNQRLRDGSRVFNIKAVSEHDPHGRYLTCFAEEEVAVL